MNKVTQKQRSSLKSIRNSKGRFFGLYTRQGKTYNAQFVNETDSYITIRDRNANRKVKLAKTSIESVTIG
jgi:hypothetical protein